MKTTFKFIALIALCLQAAACTQLPHNDNANAQMGNYAYVPAQSPHSTVLTENVDNF